MKTLKKNFQAILLFNLFLVSTLFAQNYEWRVISDHINAASNYTNLHDMHFIGNEGWITSSTFTEIYHTSDGGQTFENIAVPQTTETIYMLDARTGYIGGTGSTAPIYYTADGGTTWQEIGTISNYIANMDFPPGSSIGFVPCLDGKVYRINNTGLQAMETGQTIALHSVSFPVDTSEGWACGNNVILHYANGTWNTDQSFPSGHYRDIFFVDTQNGWAVGDHGLIVHTSDGRTWTQQQNPAVGHKSLYGVYFLNKMQGWAVGNSGTIVHTTDGGTTWTQEAFLLTSAWLWNVYAVDSHTVYAAGNDKTLLKYEDVTGVRSRESTRPEVFALEQNHPNPFNPSTTIRFRLPDREQVRVTVYDALGHEVAVLVDGELPAGEHLVHWNGTHYASGIYFYKLKSDHFDEMKKMALIK